MAKDPVKNRYYNVGIARGSYAERRLMEDAALHHMEDQPAKLIALRLTEYYQLVDRGIIVPGAAAGAIPFPIMANAGAVSPAISPISQVPSGGGRATSSTEEEGEATPPVEIIGEAPGISADAEDIWAME